jgi:predicted CopG family antitoxin
MAVKTITIDMEAYEKLAAEKKEGESFSQVIKRVLGARGMTANALLKRIEKVTLSNDTLDRIEEVVRDRERDLVQAPDLRIT